MVCPFIVEMPRVFCGASLLTYVPSDGEMRESCSNDTAESYRYCRHYQRAVWEGLTEVCPLEHEAQRERRQRADTGEMS